MAKPYRRKKNGKYIGNYRAQIGDRDLNLDTKDANEAHRRARLASQGKWPPHEVAPRVAAAMMNPATPPADAPPLGPAPGNPVQPPTEPAPPAPPEAPPIDPPDPVVPPAPPDEHSIPLDEAMRAAAGEVDAERRAADKAERAAAVDQELQGLMSELAPGGQGANEIVESVADGLAAGILWLERKSLEYGWGWTFRKPTGKTLVTKPHDRTGIERKCIRVGMKAVLTVHFPELAARLTPGWAIAIGCVMGGAVAFGSAEFVDDETQKRQTLAEAFPPPAPPPVPTSPPAAA